MGCHRILGYAKYHHTHLLQERERMANRSVAVILSGGNMERARVLQVLTGKTPAAG